MSDSFMFQIILVNNFFLVLNKINLDGVNKINIFLNFNIFDSCIMCIAKMWTGFFHNCPFKGQTKS